MKFYIFISFESCVKVCFLCDNGFISANCFHTHKHEKIKQKKGARLFKLYKFEPISSHILFTESSGNKQVQTHLNPNGWLYTSSKLQSRDHPVAVGVPTFKAPPTYKYVGICLYHIQNNVQVIFFIHSFT